MSVSPDLKQEAKSRKKPTDTENPITFLSLLPSGQTSAAIVYSTQQTVDCDSHSQVWGLSGLSGLLHSAECFPKEVLILKVCKKR